MSLEAVDQQQFLIWSAARCPWKPTSDLLHDIIMQQGSSLDYIPMAHLYSVVLIFVRSHRVSSPSSLPPLLVLSLMPGDGNPFFSSLSSLPVHPFQFSSSVQRKSSHM